MVLNDIRAIAKAVLGSGLPDTLFKEECSVYEQIKSVGSLLDLTPRQVVMLSVVMNIGSSSVNRRTIARFCEVTEEIIMKYRWDLLTLCLKGYLNLQEPFPSHNIYCLPTGLLECWRKGKMYHSGICSSHDAMYNKSCLADAVYKNVLLPYWYGKAYKTGTEVRHYMESLLFEFNNLSLCNHMDMACHIQFCPSPSLGKQILLLVIANTLHPVKGRFIGKEEVQSILFTEPTDEDKAELYCTFDFLIKTNRLQWDGHSLKLDGIIMDWVAGDLDLDLVIPFDSI